MQAVSLQVSPTRVSFLRFRVAKRNALGFLSRSGGSWGLSFPLPAIPPFELFLVSFTFAPLTLFQGCGFHVLVSLPPPGLRWPL